MIKYIEAPTEYNCAGSDKTLFLGGGITGCPKWRDEALKELKYSNLTILNPERQNFDINDNDLERGQIEWEHRHLLRANAILFWFPCETLCPITLYELGAWVARPKPIFIGYHPEYKRKRDIEIQVRLEPHRINQKIHNNISSLIDEVLIWSAS